MLGATTKLIGGILTIAGMLAALAGPAVAYYAIDDQAANEDSGLLGEDDRRTQANGEMVLMGTALALGGVVVAALGLTLVGISAAAVDGWRNRRMALQEAS